MIIKLTKISHTFLNYFVATLIGEKNLKWYESIDWEQEITHFQRPLFTYPSYYTSVNYHGIPQGYLNSIAAITYDIITPLATLPYEQWIRQCLLNEITIKPKKVIDLGCGTGSNTIKLKQMFPEALVTGLDLSPYMLIMAQKKAEDKNLQIQWIHGLAEATEMLTNSYDLITLSLLLHETPNFISQLIIKESFRLLKPQGQLIILDANQKRLKHLQLLIKLFREPYSAIYAQGNIKQWLKNVGFLKITAKPVWGIYQVTSTYKPEIF